MRRDNVQLVHHWRSSTHLRRLWRGRDKRGLIAGKSRLQRRAVTRRAGAIGGSPADPGNQQLRAKAARRSQLSGRCTRTREVGADERMRHVEEGAFLLRREVHTGQARHKRGVNHDAQRR